MIHTCVNESCTFGSVWVFHWNFLKMNITEWFYKAIWLIRTTRHVRMKYYIWGFSRWFCAYIQSLIYEIILKLQFVLMQTKKRDDRVGCQLDGNYELCNHLICGYMPFYIIQQTVGDLYEFLLHFIFIRSDSNWFCICIWM